MPVVNDREVGPQLEVADGSRQGDRADRADVGDRVADRNQVADVPVTAGGQHRNSPQRRGAQARGPGGDHHHGDRQGGDRRQERELYSRRQPRRDPGGGERNGLDDATCGGAVRVRSGDTPECQTLRVKHSGGRRRLGPRHPRPRGRAGGVSVDQDRGGREDEGDARDVVEGLTCLELDQALRAERDRGADQRLRAEPVWPPDAPGREQGHRQPAQVEHRRDDVAIEEQDSDRVEDLGVRGVERGEEDRVEEVDVAQVTGLHEPRRERHVVPEAVGAVHAGSERPQGRHHPGGGESGAGEHRDHPGESPGRRRGRRRRWSCGPAGGQPGGDQAGRHPDHGHATEHGALLEPPEGSQRLRDPDQARHREHDLDQARGGSGPPGQQQGAHPVRGPKSFDSDSTVSTE